MAGSSSSSTSRNSGSAADVPRGPGPRPCVIVISGTSGGGKSTLVSRTAELLPAAATLHFDDYVSMTNDALDIQKWLADGADPNQVTTPQLAEDLRKLTSGEQVDSPKGSALPPFPKHIVLEEPFGRSRAEIARFIDFAVHLNLPPDIAMARRLIRAIETRRPGEDEKLLEHIASDLKTYLLATREAYTAVEGAARKSADLELDGTQPVNDLARHLIAKLAEHNAQ